MKKAKVKTSNCLNINRGGCYRLIAAAILLIFIGIKMPLNAQITKQQAIDYVMDSIVGNQTDSVNVYMDSLVQSGAYYNLSAYDSIQSPYSNYWLFFIDEMPEYMWGHDCKYVFIDQANGDDWEKQKQLPPFLYEDFMQEVSISYTFSYPQPDFNVPGRSDYDVVENCNLYAVVIANWTWNDLSHIYSALREQGYPDENIYILSKDGTDSTNISMDLDNNGTDDIIPKPCSVSNVESVFDSVKQSMENDGTAYNDMLFVYTASHGGTYGEPFVTEGTYLVLWEHEPLYDYDLAAMVDSIDCSQMIFNIYACHAGGMADDLENLNNTAKKSILTAVDWENVYWPQQPFGDTTGMDQFQYYTITAFRGWHPDHYSNAPWVAMAPVGEHPKFSDLEPVDSTEINYDLIVNEGNGDGIQQIDEIINYTKKYDNLFDSCGTKTNNNGFQTDDLLSLHGISGKVETTQTLSGSFLIGGPLSVEPGVVLTLDSSASFNVFDSEIIVKPGFNNDIVDLPGGKLIVNGAKITNACDSPWKGIQVWGNANRDQFSYQYHAQPQGKLVFQNPNNQKSIIENADIAVQLFDPDNDTTTTGGIVYAKGTEFRNNEMAVLFKAYHNTHDVNNIEYDYQSSFKNCTFTVDDDYLHNTSTFEGTHIKMYDIKGVKLLGCVFENKLDLTPTGRAVHAHNAGFVVNNYCTDNSQPCQNYKKTSFNGFLHAVEAGNSAGCLYQTYIRNSDFENNGVGITYFGVNNSVIVGNNFDIGWSPACDDDMGKGIYLDNSHSFAIEDNIFELTNPISGKVYVGIHTNNTNNAGDEIYKNTFSDLVYANFAEGKNWLGDKVTGLAYYCNQNTANNWDFYVDEYNSYEDGIQKFQGSESMAAGNIFSSSATYHFDNRGAYEISYFYGSNSNIDLNKLHRVEPEPLTLSSYCPDHYGNGNDVRLSSSEYSQKETDYSTNLSLYNSALLSYESANDSTLKEYYAKQISYYNTLMNRAAYDIIRSNMSDTLVQDSLFVDWQQELDTYTSAVSMIDYYIQKGNYTTAQNKIDSLQYNFTFSAYDSVEYPFYSELKELQIDWLDDGRDIFGLTITEVNKLVTIADSSRGTAGAQARGILSFVFDTTYFYTNCVSVPDTSQKSSPVINGGDTENTDIWINASPNPANSYIDFSYSIGYKSDALLRLYDQNGVLLNKIILKKGSSTFRHNCSNYKAGIYYFSATVRKEILTGKIIIVN